MSLLEILGGIALKESAKAVLKYAFFTDGKFSPQRTILLLGWLGIAYFVYAIVPTKLIPLVSTIPIVSDIDWVRQHIAGIRSSADYLQLSQLYYLSLYCLVTLLLALIRNALGQQRVAELGETEKNILRFVHEVQLVNWYRCSSDDERKEAVKKIAEKIENSKRTRLMVIHGYHDLVKSDSLIRRALINKGRNLHLQVLLLDPFSKYAVDRAKQLRQETDIDLTIMRYIRDHARVIEALEEFRKKAASVEYRIYCSNPFFRIYLFDRDLIFQTYQAYKHGNETPMYDFLNGEKSLFHAGKEIFDYYWNKGFLHEDSWLVRMGSALTVYLGMMYGLQDDKKLPNNVDGLRREILEYVENKKREALELDAQGRITDLDH